MLFLSSIPELISHITIELSIMFPFFITSIPATSQGIETLIKQTTFLASTKIQPITIMFDRSALLSMATFMTSIIATKSIPFEYQRNSTVATYMVSRPIIVLKIKTCKMTTTFEFG